MTSAAGTFLFGCEEKVNGFWPFWNSQSQLEGQDVEIVSRDETVSWLQGGCDAPNDGLERRGGCGVRERSRAALTSIASENEKMKRSRFRAAQRGVRRLRRRETGCVR